MRMTATYLCVWKKKFTLKERFVAVIGWTPKATVQAAIGGVVLDRARKDIAKTSQYFDEYEQYGKEILTTAII